MKSLGHSNNVAARAGRWSAGHWKTATFGWLAVVALVTVLGALAGTKELSDADGMSGESARAQRIVDGAGFRDVEMEVVLVQSGRENARSPAFRHAVEHTMTALSAAGRVTKVRSPYSRGNEGQISADGHSAVIGIELNGATGDEYDGVERTQRAVAAVQRAYPRFRIEETGGPSIDKAVDGTAERDFRRAELSSIPLTVGILLVAFGALLAAFLPVVLALTAFAAATGLLAFTSRL